MFVLNCTSHIHLSKAGELPEDVPRNLSRGKVHQTIVIKPLDEIQLSIRVDQLAALYVGVLVTHKLISSPICFRMCSGCFMTNRFSSRKRLQ